MSVFLIRIDSRLLAHTDSILHSAADPMTFFNFFHMMQIALLSIALLD